MASKKFTELPVVTSLDGSEIFAVVQGGVSKQAALNQLPGTPATTFIQLTDVPNSYAGFGGYKVKVKADETGLEFVVDSGGGSVNSVNTGSGVTIDNTDPTAPIVNLGGAINQDVEIYPNVDGNFGVFFGVNAGGTSYASTAVISSRSYSGIGYTDGLGNFADINFQSSGISISAGGTANSFLVAPDTIFSGTVTVNDPSTAFHAMNKNYADANYLNLGGGTMTGTLVLAADPTSTLDAATKNYVDNLVAGLKFKQNVRVASTANVNVSSAPSSIDGVSLSNGDRVLLKDQSTGSQNGVYVFNGAGSAMTRSTDADTGTELISATFPVSEGTANQDTWWTVTNDSITIGVTSIVFTQTAAGGTYTADGTTITLTGNLFSVTNNGIGNTQLRQGSALSVIGRSANSTGNVADIAAVSDYQILRRSGTSLGFGSIDLSQSAAVGSSILGATNGGAGSTNGILKANGSGTVSAVTDADITGRLLTGYVSGAGVVASTDTILQAIQKLNGNIAAAISGAWSLASGGTLTGVNTITSNTANQLIFTGAYTTTANSQYYLNFNPTITARGTSSDDIYGLSITPSIVYGANNQTGTAIFVNVTTTPGAFTGLNSNFALFQAAGTNVFEINANGTIFLGSASSNRPRLSIATTSGSASPSGLTVRVSGAVTSAASTSVLLTTGNTSVTITNSFSANIVNINSPTFSPSSGAYNWCWLLLDGALGQSGSATGVIRGINYNPTGTWVGAHYGLTIGSTGIANIFNGLNTQTPNSTLQINGSLAPGYVEKTTTYSITAADYTINCTSGSFTVTLPTAVGCQGRVYIIKNTGAGTITLATTSSQTIDGAAPGTVAAGAYIALQSTNSNWIKIS